MNEEIKKIIDISINRAKSSLRHFFELLGYDSDLFKHLYDIDIRIDYNDNSLEAAAIYESGDDNIEHYIMLYYAYVFNMYERMNSGEFRRQYLIDEIASTIVHEMLHANRCIYVKDGLNGREASDYERYEHSSYGIDVRKLDNELDKIIHSDLYKKYDVIPVIVYTNKKNCYDIYAYNKKTDEYYVFYNLNLISLDLNFIAKYINSSQILSNVDRVFEYHNREYFTDVYDASDYYHQYHIKKNNRELNEFVEKSSILEEALVESISKLIIYSRKDSEIHLESFLKYYYGDCIFEENFIAASMLYKMGIGIIKWFLISTYEDEYDDKLYKAYKEKYELLLDYYSMLVDEYNEIDIEEIQEDIDSIVNSIR